MAGRPRIPVEQQLIHNPAAARQKLRRMSALPRPVAFLSDQPPADLPAGLQTIWRERAADLPAHLVGCESEALWACYCGLVYQQQELLRRAVSEPPVLGNDDRTRPNPTWTEYRRTVESLRRIASELGLTPTSVYRTRPRAAETETQPSAWQGL